VEEVKKSGLCGRGGAGPQNEMDSGKAQGWPVTVCNADKANQNFVIVIVEFIPLLMKE
jgi:NADH:ubiquinone oxidoreductase subunit F (NADH-binding)